jgi:hypothetical protein
MFKSYKPTSYLLSVSYICLNFVTATSASFRGSCLPASDEVSEKEFISAGPTSVMHPNPETYFEILSSNEGPMEVGFKER